MTLNNFSLKYQLLFITFFSLLCFQLNAQSNSKYSLLWKIEEKNQIKPSYLFGTMHVDDVRAFNFSDAVIPAIENSDKFALEIQPDSLIIKMFSKQENRKAYLEFKDLLSSDEYNQIAERFKKVNSYNIEESEVYDPNILMTMLQPDEDKTSDESTFVDMHLLGHAKTMRKEIVGLEDIDSQLNYFENASKSKQKEMLLDNLEYDIETYNKESETLKQIYITGDLDAINNMILQYEGYDKELKDRNIVMVNSIIKEMKNSSIFSAVGAAHLPGSYGLIKLLRKKGYTVTKVEANFTGVAKNYTIDNFKMQWHAFTDSNLGYALEAPGIPAVDKSSESVDTYIYSDLITGTSYTFFAIDFRRLAEINKGDFFDTLYKNSAENYNGVVSNKKDILIDGNKAKQFTIKLNDPEDKISGINTFSLFKNEIFYQFTVLGNFEKLYSKSATKFINSIKILQPKALAEEDWYSFVNENGAFKVDLPNKPIDGSREVANPYNEDGDPFQLYMYISTDKKNNTNSIVRYNDQPIGYRIENLDEAFESMVSAFTTKAQLVGEPKIIYQDGYFGKQYELLFEGNSHSICKLFFRGNRTYLLLFQQVEENIKVDPNNRFFSSFKLTEFKNSELIWQETEDYKFKSFKALKKNITEDVEDFDIYIYNSDDTYSKNESSGDLYSFSESKLKPYFKIDTLQNFYNLNKNNLVTWQDSIISNKNIKINNKEALEFTIMSKQDSIVSKHLIWLDGDAMFYSTANTSKENINSDLTNEILYSYVSKNKSKPFNYYNSKTKRLLKDLKSKDSVVFKHAIGAFNYYEFITEDLTELYKTVDYKFTSEENKSNVIEKIINELEILNDDKSIDFLENLYNNYNISDKLKRQILQIIPNLEYENNLAIYLKLLFNNPPEASKSNNYRLFLPFYDSIPLASKNYKSLLKLNTSKKYLSELLNISNLILNSKSEDKQAILSAFSLLNKNSEINIKEYIESQKETDKYNYTEHGLISDYLDYYKNSPKGEHSKSIEVFANQIITLDKNNWLTQMAIETKIIHGYKVSKKTKAKLLDSIDSRFSVMKAYHKGNRFNEIPKKLYENKAFSRLSLNHFFEDVDEWPTNINFLGVVIIDSIKYFAYDLEFIYNDEGNKASYLAIVKADYSVTQENEFTVFNTYTDWEELKEDWKTHAKEILEE